VDELARRVANKYLILVTPLFFLINRGGRYVAFYMRRRHYKYIAIIFSMKHTFLALKTRMTCDFCDTKCCLVKSIQNKKKYYF
jgi:hypothetical protein